MLESNQFYKNGRISFRDIKCFDKAGPYKLHVELLGFDNVKPVRNFHESSNFFY